MMIKSTPENSQRDGKKGDLLGVNPQAMIKRGLTGGGLPEERKPIKPKATTPKTTKSKAQSTNKGNKEGDGDMFDNMDPDKLDWRQMFLQEKMVGEPQSIPQSVIYKLVDETINKDATDLKCPDTGKKWDIFVYIIQIPLTHF